MKVIFLIFSLILFSSAGYASQIGCEQTIRMAIEQKIADTASTEVIQVVGEVGPNFIELRTFTVTTGAEYPPGIVGIPYTTTYLVVARALTPTTCNVEAIVRDVKAQ